jgi:putative chitinase
MDLNKLKGHIPDLVISEIPEVMEKFQINTPLRLAHFLAQCSHESGGFKVVTENLHYTEQGLESVFGRFFPNGLAKSYAMNPEKIASRVYADRMGNGNEASEDGWRFCGRGYIQLTGKANYQAFSVAINDSTILATPALIAAKYPLASAAWFFSKNGLNAISDKGATTEVVTEVTKRVNGGTNGLPDRLAKFNEYYPLLSQ